MKTRKLPSRKRKKASKGRVIRVSDAVYNHLNKQRLNRTKQSWDCYLRKLLGLPDREGNETPLLEGWIDKHTGKFFLDEAEARGASVLAMTKKKSKKFLAPIHVKEVV